LTGVALLSENHLGAGLVLREEADMSRWLLTAVLVPFATSCADDGPSRKGSGDSTIDTGGGGGTGTAEQAEAFYGQGAVVLCAGLERCDCLEINGRTLTRDECESSLRDVFVEQRPWTAVAAGRLAFDPALGDACLDDLATRACDGSDPEPESCRNAIRGLVPMGSPCTSDEECTDREALCARTEASIEAPELCVKPVAGDPCVRLGCVALDDGSVDCFYGCPDGLSCDFDPETPRCQPTVTASVGQPCSDPLIRCADGAFCDYDASPAGCAATKPDGAACSYDSQCESDNCTNDGVCAPRPACGLLSAN
jgi:hypothetical protein